MPYLKTDHPFYGSVQLFHHDEYICDHIQRNAIWEENIVTRFHQHYTKGNVIDIGAHIGLHSIALHKLIPDDKHVFSFEAHPAIYEVLEINCKNKLNIHTYNLAVSDKNDQTVYVKQIDFDAVACVNSGGQGTCDHIVEPTDLPVTTTTIDSYDFRDVALVKLDVEGHETCALAGMRQLLVEQSPVLFIEIHPEDREYKIEQIQKNYGYIPVEQITLIDFIFKKLI